MHWKNINCEYLSLCFCLLCSASVNAVQTAFSDISYDSNAKWETCQIFKDDRLLVRV
jgi:uncharacterized membrane protein YhdT